MVPRPLPLPPPSPQRHEVGTGARVAELLQLLHTPLADTLLVAERLNVARINIAVAQTARQDLERQPSKLVDLLCCARLPYLRGYAHLGDQREQRCLGAAPAESEYELERRSGRLRLSPTRTRRGEGPFVGAAAFTRVPRP